MATDLSLQHTPVGALFPKLRTAADFEPYRLSDEQIAHYHEHGYLSGVRILNDAQVEAMRNELALLFQPDHPGHELWYEYHSNESNSPDHVLFHALGAWRIEPGLHDVLWHPALVGPARQLLGGPVRDKIRVYHTHKAIKLPPPPPTPPRYDSRAVKWARACPFASRISTLCGIPASWLSKTMLNGFPAGAVAVVVVNCTPIAMILTSPAGASPML